FLQIWLLPSRKGFPPSYAQKSFTSAPANALTLACSPDGSNQSISINQNVKLYVGKLAAKGKISHALDDQRHGWVQLIEGDLGLNGNKLSPGDGAALDCEAAIRFQSEKGAHFLYFDLN
ncbi:MAG TPA: hypothetical protein VFF11_04575, partial [Candidatus Binatia bacterium]|nr:hypothetical protein [Candidatus Binatia bacterium]